MNKRRVSIAMATYNGGAFLAEQLNSFIVQSRRPDELVICDDGSTDETLAIAERFAATAPFSVIVELNPQNLGYSANFSKALSLCSGDFLFLSDQDDRWFSTKIERALERMSGGVPVVINNCMITDTDGTPWGTVLDNLRSLRLPDSEFANGACTGMSRPFATLALPFPPNIVFDHWLGSLADTLGIRAVIEEPLQMYRRHSRNTSQPVGARRNPKPFDFVRLHGLKDPRPGWTHEITAAECIAARLRERRDLAEALAGGRAVDSALARLDEDKERYRQRLELLSHPRQRRVRNVLRLWRDGFYDDFAGWKSAGKDLIRP